MHVVVDAAQLGHAASAVAQAAQFAASAAHGVDVDTVRQAMPGSRSSLASHGAQERVSIAVARIRDRLDAEGRALWLASDSYGVIERRAARMVAEVGS